MNVSAPFIARPVATILLAVGLLIAGVVAYRFLPVSPLPSVDIPTIVVLANRPGADAETMANSIAAPLERRLGEIAGVTELTSTNSVGATAIVIQFDYARDIDGAAHDVQAAINAATTDLPSDLPTRPYYRKINPADAPILTLALTSPTLSTAQIYDAADSILGQRLSQSEGVSQVTLNGAEKPAVRVQLDPVRLAAAGLSGQDVFNTIRAANVLQPTGGFQGPDTAEMIAVNGQISQAEGYRKLVLKAGNGAVVRLSDVATVVNGVASTKLAAWNGAQPAILLNVTKQAGANVIDTVERIKALLPQLLSWMPPDIRLTVVTDRTTTIRAGVDDVQYTLLLTIGLVLLVVLLFMRRLMPTIAAAVTVPLSLCGTLAGMWFLGFALDNFSLMALTISVGFVVDDAIVMIENIARHLERGMTPMHAALAGSRQIGFTVISISLSLIAVFTPLLFMGGILGKLFHEFAMTVTMAIVISAAVSLTLTPMICGRFISHAAVKAPAGKGLWGRVDRGVEWAFTRTQRFYGRTLGWALRHRVFMLLVMVATVVLTVRLYGAVPKGFLPEQDTGLLIGQTIASPDVSFQAMKQRQQAAVAVLLADPAIQSVASTTGVTSGWNSLNRGALYVSLRPISVRGVSAEQVIARLRAPLARIGGVVTTLYPAQDLRGGGRMGGAQYQFAVISQNLDDMRTWTNRLVDKLRTVPGIADITSDQDHAGPQVNVVIDRVAAARLGVTAAAIDNALNNAYAQRQISTIYTQRNQYKVVLEIDPRLQRDPSLLDRIYVGATNVTGAAGATGVNSASSATGATGTTGTTGAPGKVGTTSGVGSTGAVGATGGTGSTGRTVGAQVPLSAVARFERGTSPLGVQHQGQFPAGTISFNVTDGMSLGQATDAIDKAALELRMPDSVRVEFAGNARFLTQSLSSQPLLIGAALISIYIVLGVLYESLLHPLTILSTLPSAGVGALLALMATGTDLSIMGVIGIILLMGIVKKNGIMLVDFALEQEREHGLAPFDAILAACMERFRPIMMTTLAALLGALPLAFAWGTGAELRRPLGISIAGGLILSQALTLYTTPVVYLALERLRRGGRPRIVPPTAPAGPAAPAAAE